MKINLENLKNCASILDCTEVTDIHMLMYASIAYKQIERNIYRILKNRYGQRDILVDRDGLLELINKELDRKNTTFLENYDRQHTGN